MKIIFLDIDGPMKPGRSYFDDEKIKDQDGGWCPLSVAAINRLHVRTEARIVFSSFWNRRGLARLTDIAREQGMMAAIEGMTGLAAQHEDRLEAIAHWLAVHPANEVTHWVSLDDAVISHEFAIRVNGLNGISVENYRRASELLGVPDDFRIGTVHEPD